MLRPFERPIKVRDGAMQNSNSSTRFAHLAAPTRKGTNNEDPLTQSVRNPLERKCHNQNSKPYENVSETRCISCMVCGRSVDAIKMEKLITHMRQSTPANEPEGVTNLTREAYLNGLNAGTLLFITPAVSQAAACDGIKDTMSAENQAIVQVTLSIH